MDHTVFMLQLHHTSVTPAFTS